MQCSYCKANKESPFSNIACTDTCFRDGTNKQLDRFKLNLVGTDIANISTYQVQQEPAYNYIGLCTRKNKHKHKHFENTCVLPAKSDNDDMFC